MKTQSLKNRVANGFKLNQMNNETYALRRKVIEIIYTAKKKGFNLPRIEVRIVNTEINNGACGYAYLNKNIVHINEKWVNINNECLTFIVLHEIVHAVTGFEHDNNCYLMQPCLPSRNPNMELTWNRFGHYIK